MDIHGTKKVDYHHVNSNCEQQAVRSSHTSNLLTSFGWCHLKSIRKKPHNVLSFVVPVEIIAADDNR